MDAFAIAICTGLAQKRFRLGAALVVGLFFGVAQAAMPVFGYLIGGSFSGRISHIDHWVAFAILVFIGGKMVVDTLVARKDDCAADAPLQPESANLPETVAPERKDDSAADAPLQPASANLPETVVPERKDDSATDALSFSKLFSLAIATSIDALAVGVSFAFLPDVKIVPAACIIGLITFALSAVGVRVGFLFGARFRSWAGLAGGFMLIAIGVKILFEHLA